jgi:hypothetical protein
MTVHSSVRACMYTQRFMIRTTLFKFFKFTHSCFSRILLFCGITAFLTNCGTCWIPSLPVPIHSAYLCAVRFALRFVSEIIIYLALFPLIFSNCDIYKSITDTGIKGRLQLAISISTLSVCNYLLVYSSYLRNHGAFLQCCGP